MIATFMRLGLRRLFVVLPLVLLFGLVSGARDRSAVRLSLPVWFTRGFEVLNTVAFRIVKNGIVVSVLCHVSPPYKTCRKIVARCIPFTESVRVHEQVRAR